MNEKNLVLQYFTLWGEGRGVQSERVTTAAATPRELFEELKARIGCRMPPNIIKVIVNDAVVSWDAPLRDGDQVSFLPPFSGG